MHVIDLSFFRRLKINHAHHWAYAFILEFSNVPNKQCVTMILHTDQSILANFDFVLRFFKYNFPRNGRYILSKQYTKRYRSCVLYSRAKRYQSTVKLKVQYSTANRYRNNVTLDLCRSKWICTESMPDLRQVFVILAIYTKIKFSHPKKECSCTLSL